MIAGATGQKPAAAPMVATARAAWALVHGTAMLLVEGRIDLPPDQEPSEAAEQVTREVMAVLGQGLRSV